MDVSVRHLLGIDQALGEGVTVEFDGKSYTFSPLTFRDYAALLANRKSAALTCYLNTVRGTRQDPTERARDINAIACRAMVKDDLSSGDLNTVLFKCTLSLRKTQPAITDEEIDALLSNDMVREQIEDTFREQIAAILEVLNMGPLDFKERSGGDQEQANPT